MTKCEYEYYMGLVNDMAIALSENNIGRAAYQLGRMRENMVTEENKNGFTDEALEARA